MQLDIFAEPDGSSGKTYPAHSAATPAQTLVQWLARWQDASSLRPAMAGDKKAWRSVTPGLLNGAYSTRSGSDWRRGASACSLSSILETGPIDRRYYLSVTACAGILRRAEKRGKTLPAPLQQALAAVAARTGLKDV